MGEHYLLPGELPMLVVWIAAPVQLLTLVLMVMWFKARGVFASSARSRAVVALLATYLVSGLLVVPLWSIFPIWLLPKDMLPDRWPSLPPLVFTPALVACLLVGPVLSLWVVKNHHSR